MVSNTMNLIIQIKHAIYYIYTYIYAPAVPLLCRFMKPYRGLIMAYSCKQHKTREYLNSRKQKENYGFYKTPKKHNLETMLMTKLVDYA